MNKIITFTLLFVFMFSSCINSNLVDTNLSVPDNNWLYAKSVKAKIEVKELNKRHNVYFKLRHTVDYKYANIFVLLRLKGNGLNKAIRYEFKLAKLDGEWLGKGSGDIYSHQFLILKDFNFPQLGNYELEIEQNMRDNPLTGISDLGIIVVQK